MVEMIKAALVFVALSSACADYNRSRKAVKVGGYTMIAGASIAAVGGGIVLVKGDGEQAVVWTAIYIAVIGAVIFTPGAALAASGLIGMAAYDKPIPTSQTPPAPTPRPTSSITPKRRSSSTLMMRSELDRIDQDP